MDVASFSRHLDAEFPALGQSGVMVALSGGADSTALLHLLHRSGRVGRLTAAHVHHGVRGSEADEDAAWCRELGRHLGLDVRVLRLSGEPPAVGSREADWRRQRYEALRVAAVDLGADLIATGHQYDDVAEGVLLQLLRGAGPRAMAGINKRSGNIIRPMLPFSRSEIERWLRDEGIDWREDASNRSLDHLRNQVRHEILPSLERTSPALRRHLVRFAEIQAETEAALGNILLSEDLWIDPWHPEGGVPTERIVRLPRALRVRWLHSQARRHGLAKVTFRQGRLLERVLSGELRSLTLAGRWSLRRARGRLWLEPPAPVSPYSLDLEPEGEIPLPLPGWRVRTMSGSESPGGRWWIRVEAGTGLTLRSPRSGDRLPSGQPLAAALRSFLPRHLRSGWPILFSGDKLLWIPGVAGDGDRGHGPQIVEVTRS